MSMNPHCDNGPDYYQPEELPPKICCSKCNGTGEVIMSERHWETLQQARAFGRPFRSGELRDPRIAASGLINRLTFLEKHGLIRRLDCESKGFMWEAAEPDPAKLNHNQTKILEQ